MRRYIGKVQSRHLLTWGFVGAILLATPALANAQDTSNYIGLGATDEGVAANAKIALAKQLLVRPATLTDVEFDDERVDFIVGLDYNF